MPYLTCDSEDKWREIRNRYIGSGEVASIFGESKFATREMLLNKKRRPPETDAQFWGTQLESGVAAGLAIKEGWEIESHKKRFYYSRRYKHMGAAPDYFITNMTEKAIPLEIKTTTEDEVSQWKDGKPPIYMQRQLQQQIECTDADEGYIGVLCLDSRKRRVFHYKRDEDMIVKMGEAIEAFYDEIKAPQKGRQR